MNSLPAHAGTCVPAEASGQTRITDQNTNPRPSTRVVHVLCDGLGIRYTHCGHREMGCGWGDIWVSGPKDTHVRWGTPPPGILGNTFPSGLEEAI